jgi:hypothetical protein
MRPWLLLPVVCPAAWFGVSWYGLWPSAWSETLSDPIYAALSVVFGLVGVWIVDRLAGRGTRRMDVPESLLPPFRKPEFEPPVTANDLVSWALTPRSAARLTPWPGLRVGMPERTVTATPAPRG